MKDMFKKYYFIFYILFTVTAAVTSFTTCGDSSTQSETEIVLPDSNLSFIGENQIQQLFIVKCASRNGCHSTTDQAGGLDLTDYQSIEFHFVDNTVQLVVKGQGEQSFLYQILLGPQLGIPRMPLEEAALNSNNRHGVKTWIDEGAPEYP
jgi:hypothetical protein